MGSGLLEGIISSAKGSISVILVLGYGYGLRKLDFVSQEGERDLVRLCATFFLPALLFTEIGPLTTASNMRNYWPIIPLSLFFQGVAFIVALLSRMAGMPQHYVPILIFNNVTSLPLLLINALAATGGLDPLVTGDRTPESALKIGRVYILINALVGNVAQFALGPYLMKAGPPNGCNPEDVAEDDTLLPGSGHIALPTEEPAFGSRTIKIRFMIMANLKRAKDWILAALNPPLLGGILAVCFGLIPWFHTELFGPGVLSPLYDSINNVGKLFSAMQMMSVLICTPRKDPPCSLCIWPGSSHTDSSSLLHCPSLSFIILGQNGPIS
ncbi:hypothetical protein C8R45DRAFT_969177 [Mycena sanguinolenta]|nr:hypothetical protein C8R45DRAFT_969177 [Mycena sanguinolenta]